MSQELVVIEGLQPVEIFTTAKVTELLDKIQARIKEFVPDTSTKQGQDDIKSFAFQITKSKTLLDGIGKDYVAVIKEEPKRIDAERKRIRDTLDKWSEEVRRPVTEIEEKEKARVAQHEADLLNITQLATFTEENPTVEQILSRIERWKELAAKDWEEFRDRSAEYFGKAHDTLLKKLETRKKYDADQIELAALRQAKEEQAQKERDEKLIADALAEKEARAAAEQQKAFDALNQPAAVPPPAVSAQPVSAAAASVTAPASVPMRAAYTPDPTAIVNRKVMAAFVGQGFSEADAKRIVIAIAKGLIPNVTISYTVAETLKNDPKQIMMAG